MTLPVPRLRFPDDGLHSVLNIMERKKTKSLFVPRSHQQKTEQQQQQQEQRVRTISLRNVRINSNKKKRDSSFICENKIKKPSKTG